MFERTIYKARPAVVVRRETTHGIPGWLVILGALLLLGLLGR